MKLLQFSDFKENDSWLIVRLDAQVKTRPIDVYMVMDLPSGLILSHHMDSADTLSGESARDLLFHAKVQKGIWPRQVLLSKGDPAESSFSSLLKEHHIVLEVVPAPSLENLVTPLKQSYGEHFLSPSTLGYTFSEDIPEDEKEMAKHFVPDSYDPCSCGSGTKFKFCCKPIFRELLGAMVAAESGRRSEALNWIAQAKSIAGESAEVLCREAIVYSFFDRVKMNEVLQRCLAAHPDHPRTNYISGIELKENGDFKGAIEAYEKAIQHYPKTDKYHLNETFNNMGTAHFELGNFEGAKAAWEQALVLLPSDRVVRDNLMEFIYNNASLPEELRRPSPFVERFLKRLKRS